MAFVGVETQGGSVSWRNQSTTEGTIRTFTGVLHIIFNHEINSFLVIDTFFSGRPFSFQC